MDFETDSEIGIQIALTLLLIIGVLIYGLIKQGRVTDEVKGEAASDIEDSTTEEIDPNPHRP